jgi:hypothetical protein
MCKCRTDVDQKFRIPLAPQTVEIFCASTNISVDIHSRDLFVVTLFNYTCIYDMRTILLC